MRFLSKPNVTHQDILISSVSIIQDAILKTSVEELIEIFDESTIEYDKKGKSG
ncbi:hypothetical protein [Sporosarcina globispora]|uniref:hypothetical protein n=1 Tax=Sporosarcina globispora TaxID=1459 RepID=UPI000B1FEC10|nr:hypothetical protein [Sporosarcina globispora]